MGKFKDDFNEPMFFSDGTHVITGEITAEEAAARFSHYFGEDIKPDQLHSGTVRFGFPPEYVEDRDSLDSCCWYTGAKKGKGSKPVWVCDSR